MGNNVPELTMPQQHTNMVCVPQPEQDAMGDAQALRIGHGHENCKATSLSNSDQINIKGI